MQHRSNALLVMPHERASGLMAQLVDIKRKVWAATSCEEAATQLRDDPDISLVLTDLSLPDGSWFDVLNLVGDLHPGAKVVVCARIADERLWTKVLEAGGFDVLVEPYEESEVSRILGCAARVPLAHHLAFGSRPEAPLQSLRSA
jgi:DNA-binding NtrC family response regulator